MTEITRRGDIFWKRGDPVQKPVAREPAQPTEASSTVKSDDGEAPIKVYQCRSLPVRYDIHDSYDIGKTLGEGSTGKVKLAIHKTNKQRFAMKMIDLKNSALGPAVKRVIGTFISETFLNSFHIIVV
jgi:serine/threonine protein kinase